MRAFVVDPVEDTIYKGVWVCTRTYVQVLSVNCQRFRGISAYVIRDL
jgi:hypothetical protein